MVDTSVPKGWNLVNGGMKSYTDVDVTEMEFYDLLKNSKEMYIKNQTYYACIETYGKFVYGKGPKVQAAIEESTPGEEPSAEEVAIGKAREGGAYT